MGIGKRQQELRAMRGQMQPPGRPSTARREDRVWFWGPSLIELRVKTPAKALDEYPLASYQSNSTATTS